MKKIIPYLLLCSLVFSINAGALPASNIPPTPRPNSMIASILTKFLDGHKKKLNFFERIVVKMVAKKMKKMIAKADGAPIDADKLARQANTFGWLSLAMLFIFPLATIPLAVLAISKAGMALENNTSLPQKARTGRILAIVTLGALLLAIGLIVVVFATGGFS
jgi:hypothetical protein